MQTGKGEIIVVSAPSGAGKTSIVKQILKQYPQIVFSVSATTRPKRAVETDGIEYYFITEKEFIEKIESDEFVEWEKFYDYYYWTFKKSVDNCINEKKTILLELDVKGSLSLKKIYPAAHLIYIMPPSYQELIKRLKDRQTESSMDFKKRVERAKMELMLKDQFDYIIENKYLEKAINETSSLIKKIIKQEKWIMKIQPIDLRSIDERAANIYEAIIVSAKRARQINDENKIEFNALLSTIPTVASEDENEDIENPAQLKIALDMEAREKPQIQSIKELLDGEIEYNYKD